MVHREARLRALILRERRFGPVYDIVALPMNKPTLYEVAKDARVV